MGFWSTEARDRSSRHCVVAPHFAVLQVGALVLYADRVDARAAASSHPTTRDGRRDPLRGLPVHRAAATRDGRSMTAAAPGVQTAGVSGFHAVPLQLFAGRARGPKLQRSLQLQRITSDG